MSEVTHKHKEKAREQLGFAVIVCSTGRFEKLSAHETVDDESGDLIVQLLRQHGHIVPYRRVVPDDKSDITKSLKEALRLQNVDAAILCGGTGISPTDVTLETIKPLMRKELGGFGEIFRWLSHAQIGSAAIMTRASAGIIDRKAVFCIPGSPQAVKLSLERLILPEAGHIVLHASGRG